MKKTLLLLLTFALIAAIAACTPAEPAPGTDGSTPSAEQTDAPEDTTAPVEENPFVVPADMDGIRKKTIEYFDAMSAVKWIAPERMDYTDDCPWTTKLIYEKGRTYYGLPYSTYLDPGVGLSEFETYLDAKGVYTGPTEYRQLIGGDCGSMRRAWAWGGAICGFGMTFDDWEMFVYENTYDNKQPVLVKLGEYDDSHFAKNTTTNECVIAHNDSDVMYESYALLKSCDLIGARFNLSGGSVAQHVRMLVEDATVMRLGNGKIAPAKSYIVFSEQTSTVHTVDGKQSTWLLNQQISFTDLLKDGYIPMSTVTLQQSEVTQPEMEGSGFSKPENFASSPMLKGTIKCNYNIFETEVTITDKDGNVASHMKIYPYSMKVILSEHELSTPVKELPSGDYHFKVTATIGFGTKTVAEFDFTK